MILRWSHRDIALTVAYDVEAHLLPRKKLFYQKTSPRFAEISVSHDPVDTGNRLICIGCDDHTFARRETIGLYHQRPIGFSNVGFGLRGIFEDSKIRSGDTVALHEQLGVHLGALKLGSRLARTKRRDALRFKSIDETRHQGCLGTYHNQINQLLGRQGH
jgi:hypothetical protein